MDVYANGITALPGYPPVDHDLIMAKTLAMIFLGHGSFLLCVVPLKLTQRWRTLPFSLGAAAATRRPRLPVRAVDVVASLSQYFGAGAMLCAALLRLLPDVRDAVATLQRDGRLPATGRLFRDALFCDALLCAGFFAAYLVDELAHAALDRYRGPDEDAMRRLLSLRDGRRSTPEEKTENNGQEREQEHASAGGVVDIDDGLRGMLTILALSGHELFAAMAVGLEDRTDRVWGLFAGVAARKLTAACCVGLQLARTVSSRSELVVYSFAVALVAPIGVAFGMVVTHYGFPPAPGPAAVVLRGLAAGAMLYAVSFDVLPLRGRPGGWSRFLSVVVGFVVQSAL